MLVHIGLVQALHCFYQKGKVFFFPAHHYGTDQNPYSPPHFLIIRRKSPISSYYSTIA